MLLGSFPHVIMIRFLFLLLAFNHLVHGTSVKEVFSHKYDEKIAECFINKSAIHGSCIQVSVLPRRYIFAEVGKYVRIHMDQSSNNKNATCYAYYRGKWMYNMYGDLPGEDIKPYGLCGIQMRVNPNREGEWSLHQILGYVIKVTNFTIVIKKQFYFHQPIPDLMFGEESQIESNINRSLTVTLEKPPGDIDHCYAYRDNFENAVFSKNVTPTNCTFTIAMADDSYYGKWTFTTVYQNKNIPRSLKLINNFYIYKSIKKDSAMPYSVIYAQENETIQVSPKTCKNDSVYQNTCKLIHKPSGIEYNLSLCKTYAKDSIHLIDSACCRLEIISLKEKHYGEWWIEESFRTELRRSYFSIINPKDVANTGVNYPCKKC